MKKKEVKKLQLSRETLLDLKNPEVQKVVRAGDGAGANNFSSVSYCGTTNPGGC